MGRRELLDVAGAIASSFISRNNDIDGYWGLGLLRSYADSHQFRSLRFNILNGDAQPEDRLLACVADAYRQVLARQLTIRRISRDVISGGEVIVTFDRDAPNAPSAATHGSPFSCTVRLTDHRERVFERVRIGCCAPHNPRLEQQSTLVREGSVKYRHRAQLAT